MSHGKAQPMEALKHGELAQKEELSTDEVAHFHHKGGYIATFQYLDKNNRWMGWGDVKLGEYKTVPWWPGLKFRAYAERLFVDPYLIYEGAIGAGQTLAIWGTVFEPVAGIYGKAEAMEMLKTENVPVYATFERE